MPPGMPEATGPAAVDIVAAAGTLWCGGLAAANCLGSSRNWLMPTKHEGDGFLVDWVGRQENLSSDLPCLLQALDAPSNATSRILESLGTTHHHRSCPNGRCDDPYDAPLRAWVSQRLWTPPRWAERGYAFHRIVECSRSRAVRDGAKRG